MLIAGDWPAWTPPRLALLEAPVMGAADDGWLATVKSALGEVNGGAAKAQLALGLAAAFELRDRSVDGRRAAPPCCGS